MCKSSFKNKNLGHYFQAMKMCLQIIDIKKKYSVLNYSEDEHIRSRFMQSCNVQK